MITQVIFSELIFFLTFITCNVKHFTDNTTLFWEANYIECLFPFHDLQDAVPDDNIDLLLEKLEQSNGLSLQNEDCGVSDRRAVLHVEHR